MSGIGKGTYFVKTFEKSVVKKKRRESKGKYKPKEEDVTENTVVNTVSPT